MNTCEGNELSIHSFQAISKRAFDLVLAILLSFVAAPLLLVVALGVTLTSSGPVIYKQTRMGKGRRMFTIFKVRTMYDDCERLSGPKWSTANDPRVTPLGHFLRKTHLDELPQLWNVLRGDMSLVGPRPERPVFIAQLEKALPRYAERLTVRPGLTGLAQVNLPPDIDQLSVRRKLVYDLYYVENQGFWLDIRVILGTGLFLAGVPFKASSRLLGLTIGTDRPSGHGPIERNAGLNIELNHQALPVWMDS
ncbi:MAG: hypothetical protein NVSMB9_00890 [Isosphaeraceae bacterium]